MSILPMWMAMETSMFYRPLLFLQMVEFLGIKMTDSKNFTEIVIDSNGQESVVASDFDGDGDIDVISSGRPFPGT